MNNVGEKFLPIGTVVMLKGGSKRVMITGFCSMAAEDQSKMFDYAGCMFPEGFLSSDQTALFNHEQIEKIYHMGLVDDEEQKFKSTLKSLVNQMSAGNINSIQQSKQATIEQPVPPVGPGLPGFNGLQSTQTKTVANGYNFDANGNVSAAPTTSSTQQTVPNNIKFDANGTVVSE